MIPIAAPDVGEAEREAVEAVLSSGQLADGPAVREFESAFAALCDVEHAVATTNGTTALHATFEALGVGEGDAVITTPFSFVASANAIRLAGAEPVFADIDPETLTLDPTAVAEVLAERDDVVAMLPVHLYGMPAEMDRLRALADAHDVALVEDAAQAHGARYEGEAVGSIGDAGCFSFYPTKNATSAEGGIVTTDDPELAERLRRFIDHGRVSGYEHAEVGHNFRMTSVCAAIGRVQLDRLPSFNIARRGNAAYLTDRLQDTAVETPPERSGARSAHHQYTIRTDERDALADHLEERGVASAVYYPTPIHEQPAYADYDADLPVAERAADRVLSLPVHPGLDVDDLRQIARAVETFDAGVETATPEAEVMDS
ncbi:DegT/DnrJ/EryC1/StrS family aminotransferase (plasmid) [Halolamina sp. CBA1230]|uniref:DegT/DnrJ/EryC1/StrS family aminotransferase n=1 Tax=Halolamina sp. CBA1230 TaxID=1853690 RepID=UPI0009A15750|nr:DegT/DnrJ/EryC1/StrS family aminotransferase [Halolamina sp. CBA1230]QKY21956.1 DegT/DnrJ/EryC1/StrS family aminotransferase [Halolamina sp. CBA1230]